MTRVTDTKKTIEENNKLFDFVVAYHRAFSAKKCEGCIFAAREEFKYCRASGARYLYSYDTGHQIVTTYELNKKCAREILEKTDFEL